MQCWSCGQPMPEKAQRCPHCEAEIEPPLSKEEQAGAEAMLSALGPEVISQLREIFENSETGEEFVNSVMIGPCPKCESAKTSDCDKDPDVEDICIGRCFDCGQYWCTDCEELFKSAQAASAHDCPAWEDFDEDDFDEDEFDEGDWPI